MYMLIEHKTEGIYTASLIGFPGVQAQATSEQEAIALLRRSLTDHLHHAKIVPLDVDLTQAENPWLQLGERLQANPLLAEVAESMTEYRNQLDSIPEAA
jgi:predicted RNase H-like HicB family nuclease